MKMSNQRGLAFVLAVASATAAVIACGSSSEDEDAATSAGAKGFYTEKVHQPLMASCGKCHATGTFGSPVFVASDSKASYNALEGFPGLLSAPSISPLLQKGPHSGPALSTNESALITEWLKLEVQERNLGSDPGVPKNLRAAFKAFGACMDYGRWKELKLHTIAVTVTEGNNGQCRSCHNYGQASFPSAGGTDNPADEPNNAITFAKLREFPYVQRLVVGRVIGDSNPKVAPGSFDAIEPARRIVEKGSEAQPQQANVHPRYSLPSEITANLSTFVLETLSNMQANRCQNVISPDAGLFDAANQF